MKSNRTKGQELAQSFRPYVFQWIFPGGSKSKRQYDAEARRAINKMGKAIDNLLNPVIALFQEIDKLDIRGKGKHNHHKVNIIVQRSRQILPNLIVKQPEKVQAKAEAKDKPLTFTQFKKSRQVLTVDEYFKAIRIEEAEDKERFAEIEAFHYYELRPSKSAKDIPSYTVFYQIRNGEKWNYDDFNSTSMKYFHSIDDDKKIERQNFDKMEQAVYRQYLKDFQ